MIDVTALIGSTKPPLENSGLEYIIFELLRNALQHKSSQNSDYAAQKWKIMWGMRQDEVLAAIRIELAKLSPKKRHANTFIGQRTIYNSVEDIEAQLSQTEDIEDQKQIDYLSFGKFKIPYYGEIDLHNLECIFDKSVTPTDITLENTAKYEANHGQGSVAEIIQALRDFEAYKTKVTQILVRGYSLIIEDIFGDNAVTDLPDGDLLDAGHDDHKEVLTRFAATLVNAKSKIANLHVKSDFAFSKIDLGYGEFAFPLDLNDLSKIDTARFNTVYSIGYNQTAKIGFAEKFLSELDIQSLQAQNFAKYDSYSSNDDSSGSPLRMMRFSFPKKNSGSESPPPRKMGSPTVGVPLSPRRTSSTFNLMSFQNFVGSKPLDAFASEGSGFALSRAPTPTSPTTPGSPLRVGSRSVIKQQKRFSSPKTGM